MTIDVFASFLYVYASLEAGFPVKISQEPGRLTLSEVKVTQKSSVPMSIMTPSLQGPFTRQNRLKLLSEVFSR